MQEEKFLANQFEANRARLRSVAYRMLGSLNEAEDAVQEAWIRLSRSDAGEISNLGGWLTTVVARVCLDMLRSRKARREEPMGPHVPEPATDPGAAQQEALMADSVGLAMLVVLQTLAPAERIAFVLHDMFDMPFDDIAPILKRTPVATRQLASRARRRIHAADKTAEPDIAEHRQVIDAFLAAARNGDFEGLLALLDPDVVGRADPTAARMGGLTEVRGAQTVAGYFRGRAQAARTALVDGVVGVVVAPSGRLMLVLNVTVTNGKISLIEAVADPERLKKMELSAF